MAENLTGKLLIASPYLTDPNFMRSVVLIINHDHEGAFGLSLNRPTQQRLSDAIELSMPTGQVRSDDQIYEGGPVDGPLLAIHGLTGVGTQISCDSSGVWLTGEEDHLRLLLTRTDVSVRFISQYSGWGPGQLDGELVSGGWLVGPVDRETVFGDADEIWERAVKRCGHDILSTLSPGLRFDDPPVN